uniref:Uncharacterized protein n=1 Tax=Tanacetum cinerariifolium TaxID=118510 RepID=A0A6L2JEF1_TANCI|nr:hypothetical protein [Tanacetum cinerariifolium]
MESIYYHHQQVLKWQINWNRQDLFVPCSITLGINLFRGDTQSKVPDEQQLKTTGADEGTDNESDFVDKSDGDDNNDGSSDNQDDDSDDERTKYDRDEIPDPNLTNVDQTKHEEENVNERVHTPSDYELTDAKKIHDEENIDEEEEDEVTKELYDDANVNLGNKDTEMTNADQGASEQQNASQRLGLEQKEEYAHVTLTPVVDTQKTGAHHATTIPEIPSSFTTTIPPPPPFFNPLLQQATPTRIPTASETTTLLPTIPNFAYVFKFNERVTNLKKDLSEIKQVDQYAQDLSLIPAIVDRYMDDKLGEAINKAIQGHNFNCKEEAQTEKKDDYKRELYDTLVKSYNPDKDIFDSYGEVFLLMRSQDERGKDRDPSAGSDRGTKRRKSSKDAESSRDSKSKENKSLSTSKDASQSQHKYSSKSAHAEEPSHTIKDSGMQ